MTPERAKEVITKQNEFPYWGNYQKFMQLGEISYVQELFQKHASGAVSFASIVRAIARGEYQPPELSGEASSEPSATSPTGETS